MAPQFREELFIVASLREGNNKKLDFLADMSAKLWPPPLSPFSGKKQKIYFYCLF